MPQDEFDALWSSPTNWTRLGFYRCADDPRLMVPKRVGIGYTINVAHRRSWWVLVALLGVAVAPILVNLALGLRATGRLLLWTLLTPLAVVVMALVWLSRRDDD